MDQSQLQSQPQPQIQLEQERHTLKVKLIPARSAEERSRNIIANVVVEGKQAALVPYIDEQISGTTISSQLEAFNPWAKDKPSLRYYAVGPSTYKLKCPLCKQSGQAAVMRLSELKDATCWLSMLSCIFPIFWVCCICSWCGCDREWLTKGIYCSHCGGKLGLQQKAK